MRFLQLGDTTVNLELISRVQWAFAGHKDTAMITFNGGDFHWVKEPEQAEKLRLVTIFYDYDHKSA